ncbi:MAG: response regulator [Alphaproteobacteria bacterium]|nr:response regulator [Alphaproteobacteria bacterium]
MKTCIVVDDSRVIRMVARKILEDLGFEVTEAENGQIALDMCQKSLPDSVLLDWGMPVMDGLEFLKRLRALPNGSHTKVIFCTTEADVARISEALSFGADEYIMKPFDSEIVASKFLQVGLL